MKRLVEMVVGNPAALLWLLMVAFVAGIASGAGPAWYAQGLRLDALQSKYDGFVATTKAQGEAAQREAETKAKADRYRSATVCDRMSAVVADSGTVQANTSLAMAPKPRLFFLSTYLGR